jgi:hypothetical protein
VEKEFEYNSKKYTVLRHDCNDVLYTDGTRIYTINKSTGVGLKGRGNNEYELASGFSPTKFTADQELLDAIASMTNVSEYVGRFYKPIASAHVKVMRVLSSIPHDTHYHLCVYCSKNGVFKENIDPTSGYQEITEEEFLKTAKETLASLLSNSSLSSKLLKRF